MDNIPHKMFLEAPHVASSSARFSNEIQRNFRFGNGLDLPRRFLRAITLAPRKLGSLQRMVTTAEDGRRYVLLDNEIKNGAAVNEFFSSRLGDECGVPIPHSTLLDYEGKPFFGSRYVCGRLSLGRLQDERSNPTSLGCQLSAVYAFDQLLANTDRTTENLFFLREDERVVVEAIDFSEAGIFGENWEGDSILREGSSTNQTFDSLFSDFPFNHSYALSVLDKAFHISPYFLTDCTNLLPQAWRNSSALSRWHEWWLSSRLRRIEALYKLIDAK